MRCTLGRATCAARRTPGTRSGQRRQMDSWIVEMWRAKYRKQVIAWGLTAALGVAIAFVNSRYIANFLRGPFDVGAAELAQLGDVTTAPHYFVKVAGTKALATGLQEVSVETESGVEKSRTVTANYYALEVGNRLLVVKSTGSTMRVAAGALAAMSPDLESNLFASPEMQSARSHFYPFYLDPASSFRAGGYCGIGIGIALLSLLGWKAPPAWHGLHAASSNPLAARVGKWGSAVEIGRASCRERV